MLPEAVESALDSTNPTISNRGKKKRTKVKLTSSDQWKVEILRNKNQEQICLPYSANMQGMALVIRLYFEYKLIKKTFPTKNSGKRIFWFFNQSWKFFRYLTVFLTISWKKWKKIATELYAARGTSDINWKLDVKILFCSNCRNSIKFAVIYRKSSILSQLRKTSLSQVSETKIRSCASFQLRYYRTDSKMTVQK